MRRSPDDRRRGRDLARGLRAPPARGRLLALGGLSAALLGLAAASVFAAASKPVTVPDPRGDVTGALDMQRLSLQRASDGRLRASVTFAGPVRPRDLLVDSGPPGSVCLRVWTARDADPRSMRPDRLVCVTARSADDLRASVLEQRDAGLPRRVGSASVRRTRSGRSLIVRVAQSALGRPERIRVAAESTRPGCERTSCIDTAPGAPSTRIFRLR